MPKLDNISERLNNTGDNRSNGRKTCPVASLSTTNPTWNEVWAPTVMDNLLSPWSRTQSLIVLHG